MTGRRAMDTRAACPVSGGGHRCLLVDLIRAGGPSCPAGGRVAQAPAGDLLLAASPARGLLTGYVRTSMWITCA